MEEEFEPIEVSDEITDLISAGPLSGGDQSDIKRYVEWFKSKKYSLWHTQTYWVEHMRKAKINSFSEQEARDYIASIWERSAQVQVREAVALC